MYLPLKVPSSGMKFILKIFWEEDFFLNLSPSPPPFFSPPPTLLTGDNLDLNPMLS